MVTWPVLDHSSPAPLYVQLYDFIRRQIGSGMLSPGVKLPPTRDLSSKLRLNRATVAQAYQLLEKDGLLYSHVGRGSYVTVPGAPERGSWSQLSEGGREPVPGLAGAELPYRFASSRPPEDLFPLEEFRESAEAVLNQANLPAILQLGSPLGYGPLREYLGSISGEDSPGRILITNGCQQALDLLNRALMRPGDAVVVEDPVYAGLREVFHRGGARLVPVPMTMDGLDLNQANQQSSVPERLDLPGTPTAAHTPNS